MTVMNKVEISIKDALARNNDMKAKLLEAQKDISVQLAKLDKEISDLNHERAEIRLMRAYLTGNTKHEQDVEKHALSDFIRQNQAELAKQYLNAQQNGNN